MPSPSRRRRTVARHNKSTYSQENHGGRPAARRRGPGCRPRHRQQCSTNLMTRLILDHADKNRICSMTETGHDL